MLSTYSTGTASMHTLGNKLLIHILTDIRAVAQLARPGHSPSPRRQRPSTAPAKSRAQLADDAVSVSDFGKGMDPEEWGEADDVARLISSTMQGDGESRTGTSAARLERGRPAVQDPRVTFLRWAQARRRRRCCQVCSFICIASHLHRPPQCLLNTTIGAETATCIGSTGSLHCTVRLILTQFQSSSSCCRPCGHGQRWCGGSKSCAADSDLGRARGSSAGGCAPS